MRTIWTLPGVTLVTSAYAIDEAPRNIGDDDHIERLIELLRGVEIHEDDPDAPPLDAALPAKDIPILQGAIRAAAKCS